MINTELVIVHETIHLPTNKQHTFSDAAWKKKIETGAYIEYRHVKTMRVPADASKRVNVIDYVQRASKAGGGGCTSCGS